MWHRNGRGQHQGNRSFSRRRRLLEVRGLGEGRSLRLLAVAGGFHRGRDLVETVVEEVTVGVQGHRGGGVAELLLDDLDVGARRDGKAGGGMAQLVGVQVGHSDRRRGGRERVSERQSARSPVG